MDAASGGYRRNFILLVGNYVTFTAGLACFSGSTVMPLFLRHLTDSAPLIGLVTALFPLSWMFPQLIAARWISNKARRKPFLVYPSIGAPANFAILAAIMFLADPHRLSWLLPVFIVSMLVLGFIDGLVGVPWLDFIGTAIPGHLRGRMMGLQELLFAITSVGVGVLVGHFLGENAPPFPDNFAWLAASAAGAYFVALLFFVPLQEPQHRGVALKQPTWSEYLPVLGRILRTDRVFLTLIGARALNGLARLAFPFYVLYAISEFGIPAGATGFFLSAQLVGSAAGSMVLGYLYDRHGSRLVIRITTVLSLAAPAAALLAPALGLTGMALQWFFGLVFFTLGLGGMSSAATFIGYTNFVIDCSAPADRPAYLGLANTLAGPTVLAATAGGWLLQKTNYQVLFAVTAAFLLVAQIFAFRLPEPRRKPPPAPAP